jgi:hypothetical protein
MIGVNAALTRLPTWLPIWRGADNDFDPAVTRRIVRGAMGAQ